MTPTLSCRAASTAKTFTASLPATAARARAWEMRARPSMLVGGGGEQHREARVRKARRDVAILRDDDEGDPAPLALVDHHLSETPGAAHADVIVQGREDARVVVRRTHLLEAARCGSAPPRDAFGDCGAAPLPAGRPRLPRPPVAPGL